MPAPTAPVTDRVAMARVAVSLERWLLARAIVTGKSPRPTPCKPRPITIVMKLVDTADSTHPSNTMPRANGMTLRWNGPSGSRPITGGANAHALSRGGSVQPDSDGFVVPLPGDV